MTGRSPPPSPFALNSSISTLDTTIGSLSYPKKKKTNDQHAQSQCSVSGKKSYRGQICNNKEATIEFSRKSSRPCTHPSCTPRINDIASPHDQLITPITRVHTHSESPPSTKASNGSGKRSTASRDYGEPHEKTKHRMYKRRAKKRQTSYTYCLSLSRARAGSRPVIFPRTRNNAAAEEAEAAAGIVII